MDARTVILRLSLIDGVGPATIAKMSAVLSTDSLAWQTVYRMTETHVMHTFGLSRTIAHKIETGLRTMSLLTQELDLIQRHAIQWVTVLDDTYPSLLRHIHTPPAVLYWRGACLQQLSARAIAMIGSRRANAYGQRIINKFVPPLVENAYTIVSGGAVGADTMAHRAAVNNKGTTIVVLGSGLLRPYPRENVPLFADILSAGGAVMSIFPLTTEPVPGNFPARNRVIAGLSHSCIVVQAAARSGAAITAAYALEQGRDVFAVPGALDDELSAGCHALIKEGATLLADITDIPGYVGYQRGAAKAEEPHGIVCAPYQPAIAQDLQELDPLLALCDTPRSIDELVVLSGTAFELVQDRLFELQLEGRVVQDFTGMWRSC